MVDLPLAKIGSFSRKDLCEEQNNCESLTKCRNWGKDNQKGYFYDSGLFCITVMHLKTS